MSSRGATGFILGTLPGRRNEQEPAPSAGISAPEFEALPAIMEVGSTGPDSKGLAYANRLPSQWVSTLSKKQQTYPIRLMGTSVDPVCSHRSLGVSHRRRLCGCRVATYPSALPVMPITRCLEV